MFSNKLSIAVTADSIAVIIQSWGFKKNIIYKQHEKFDRHKTEPLWQTVTNELDLMLDRMKLKPKTQLQLVISSEFVRYIVLPAQEVLMSFSEKMVYTETVFQELYGDKATDWEFKLHDAQWQHATLAVAINKNFLESLHHVVVKHQLKLKSAQPYLMAAFNSLSKQISGESGYLAIIEAGRILLVQLKQGKWQNVRPYVVKSDWQFELEQLLKRESVLYEDVSRKVWVYAPYHISVVLNEINGWQTKRIKQAKAELNNPNFAMLQVFE